MEPSSLTVLLEPTNLRVAFLILRKEPPTPCTYLVSWMVYLIFFFFLFHLGDCITILSFCLLGRNIPIMPVHFGGVLSAYSQLNQKEQERGEDIFSNKPHPWFTMRLWWLTASLRCRCCFFSLAFLKEQAPAVRQLQTLRELCSRRAKSS